VVHSILSQRKRLNYNSSSAASLLHASSKLFGLCVSSEIISDVRYVTVCLWWDVQ
jgi:hypothetical protein